MGCVSRKDGTEGRGEGKGFNTCQWFRLCMMHTPVIAIMECVKVCARFCSFFFTIPSSVCGNVAETMLKPWL